MHTSNKMSWRKVASLFTVASFAVLSLVGCKDDNTEDEKAKLALNPTSISFNDAGAGSRTVQITTSAKEGQLTAVSNVTWIKTDIRGTKQMLVTVQANGAEEPREGIVTVQTADGQTATLAVSQVGLKPSLDVNKASIEAKAEGETVPITVTSNIEWTVENANDWIDAASNEDGSVCTVVVAPSALFEAREGSFTLMPVDPKFEKFAKEITVIQKANEYKVTVTSEQIADNKAAMNANADDIILSLVANSAWTITSEQDWIHADPAEGGKTEAEGIEVIVGIDENTDSEERKGSFTVTCGTGDSKDVKTIEVTQRGAGLFIEVDNKDKNQVFTDAGGDAIITVNTNGQLAATTQDSWITASVDGNTVKISVGTNTGEKKTGKVTVSASQEGKPASSVEITVTQLKFATDLSADETANCYIVKEAGTYKFKATVMGNGKSTDRFVAAAKELNPSAASLVWSTVDTTVNKTAITDIEYSNGYIYFTTDGTEQNALIAAKEVTVDNFGNESAFILWSWHLWITNYDPENELNQYNVLGSDNTEGLPGTWAMPATWMSRNLGAMHEGNTGNYDDVQKSLGLLYQWGRKDPFPGGIVTDWGTADDEYNWAGTGVSNDIVYYYDYTGAEESTQTSSEQFIRTRDVEFESVKDNVQVSIENPSVYIKNTNYPYRWISTESCNETHNVAPDDPRDGWGYLWGNCSDDASSVGEKSIYDPCPAGWQIPCAQMFKFVTSHADAAGVQWASVGIWRLNCKEAYDADIQNAIQVPSQAVSGWPDASQAKIKFPTFKGGFNFYIEDHGVQGASKGTITKNVDGSGKALDDVDISIDGFESEPTGQTMFMPAAGQRTYAGGLTRVGSSARYHANGVRTLEASWVAHHPKGMECDAHNGFYWGYRSDYNQQGSACSVRCVKTTDIE